jgi:hypothetical protein
LTVTDTQTPNLSQIAGSAEQILEDVMRVEPTLVGIAGAFVPEVAVVQPVIMAAVPFLENALKAVAANNGGDMLGALISIFQHLTPGLPNAAALAPLPTEESDSTKGSG